jgi:hypothetical protein
MLTSFACTSLFVASGHDVCLLTPDLVCPLLAHPRPLLADADEPGVLYLPSKMGEGGFARPVAEVSVHHRTHGHLNFPLYKRHCYVEQHPISRMIVLITSHSSTQGSWP